MLLSDNISLLFNQKQNGDILFKANPDLYYFPDIKAHLNKNTDYRKQRREWAKTKPTEHVAWCLFRIKDEFCQEYIEPFHEDIEKFIGYYPGLQPKEIAEKFCKSWKLYNDVFGLEFVERAIILSMWRQPVNLWDYHFKIEALDFVTPKPVFIHAELLQEDVNETETI
jgi:hypothetical protein